MDIKLCTATWPKSHAEYIETLEESMLRIRLMPDKSLSGYLTAFIQTEMYELAQCVIDTAKDRGIKLQN